MRRKALILLIGLIAAGCQAYPSGPETRDPVRGGTITLGYAGGPPVLDVHRSPVPHLAHYLVLDRLVTRDPGGSYVGHLASGWSIEDEGLRIQLDLRDGVYYHDGSPLTAESVVENLYRLRSEASASPLLPGAVRRFLEAFRSAEATGDLSLSISLHGPVPELFHVLTTPYLAPMSPAGWGGEGDQAVVYGTGPYRQGSRRGDGTLVLERNPAYIWPPEHYENTGPAFPSSVVLRRFPDDIRMLADFRAGLLDIGPLPEFAGGVEDDGGVTYHISHLPVVYSLAFNVNRAPWNVTSMRRAVALAIDRDLIVDAVCVTAAPNAGPLSPGVWGYMEHLACSSLHPPDVDAAASLLSREVSRLGGSGSSDVTLLAFRGGDGPAVASAIGSQLAAAGLAVNISLVDAPAFWTALGAGDFDMALASFSWDEPSFLYRYFHSRGDLNRTGVSDPDVDTLLDLLAQTVDPSEQQHLLADIQDLLIGRTYWIWLYTPLTVTASRAEVVGFRLSPWGEYWLHDAYLRAGD